MDANPFITSYNSGKYHSPYFIAKVRPLFLPFPSQKVVMR